MVLSAMYARSKDFQRAFGKNTMKSENAVAGEFFHFFPGAEDLFGEYNEMSHHILF